MPTGNTAVTRMGSPVPYTSVIFFPHMSYLLSWGGTWWCGDFPRPPPFFCLSFPLMGYCIIAHQCTRHNTQPLYHHNTHPLTLLPVFSIILSFRFPSGQFHLPQRTNTYLCKSIYSFHLPGLQYWDFPYWPFSPFRSLVASLLLPQVLGLLRWHQDVMLTKW